MTHSAIEEYVAAVRPRYRAARKVEKTKILDEFCQTTGMHRKAAVRLLNRGTKPRLVGRGRPKRYGMALMETLVQVWEVSDRLCGKLLKPVIPDLLLSLERHGELFLSEEVRSQLLTISAASIDRLLRIHKRDAVRQPHRKPPHPSSLKSQVPIRTWSEWRDMKPGSVQADLVLHCGESTEGFYLTSLCVIDVATGWTELEAVWGLGQHRVTAAVHLARGRLPFELHALHTDNGAEFINQTLFAYCRREQISFSRGRPYKKNDQAYVEQRNYLAIRRLVGHDRLRSQKAQRLLHQLYSLLRLQLNFLRPVRKLVSKQRLGAKVVKHYDQPRTPYQRLLESACLTEQIAHDLALVRDRINPAELQRRIAATLHQLWRLGSQERGLEQKLG
jgi:hypothetical protein